MMEIPFWPAEAAFLLLWAVCRGILWMRRGQISWKREAALLLMYFNLAVILRFTFFPMAKAEGRVQPLLFDSGTMFPLRINLVPLVHMFDFGSMRDICWNVLGNAAMFIPTGIVLPVLYKRLNSFWKVVLAGAGISLCIEILQLPFAVRASDVDDLLLNTLGVVLGYGIYALVRGIRRISRS